MSIEWDEDAFASDMAALEAGVKAVDGSGLSAINAQSSVPSVGQFTDVFTRLQRVMALYADFAASDLQRTRTSPTVLGRADEVTAAVIRSVQDAAGAVRDSGSGGGGNG